MKKLILILLLLGSIVPVFAEEGTGVQVLEKRENKANITFMKQPLTQNSQQKVIIEKNWFCINIINNGKAIKVKKDKNEQDAE